MAKKLSLKNVPEENMKKTRDGLFTLLTDWKMNFNFGFPIILDQDRLEQVFKIILAESLLRKETFPDLSFLNINQNFYHYTGILQDFYVSCREELEEAFEKAFSFFVENWPELVAEE